MLANILKIYNLSDLKSDKLYIFSILASMSMLMMFQDLYMTNNQILGLMIDLALIGFRVTIVIYVFMGVNNIIRRLESAMLSYNIDVQNIDSHYTLIKRHRIYVLLKLTLFAWMALNTVAFFTNLMMYEGSYDNWIYLMNTEFLDFTLFGMIACNLRLRAVPHLFLSSSSPPPSASLSHDDVSSSSVNRTDDEVTPGEFPGHIEMVTLGMNRGTITSSLRNRDNDSNSDEGGSSSSDSNNIDLISASILGNNDDVGEQGDNINDDDDEIMLINKNKHR